MPEVIAPAMPWTQARALRRAIPSLGLTQMIGWGTTYYIPAILAKRFEADLGLSDGAIFGAIAVMLIVSAFISWPMGKLIDRKGAKLIMPMGSLVFAVALGLHSFAQGIVSYFACWALMGIGMTMALSNAAFAGLSQIAGKDARRAIGMLMLFGGMASTVFWPLTLWLDGLVGWRNICLIYAAMHVFVCAPLHFFVLPTDDQRKYVIESHDADVVGTLPPESQRLAAYLMVVIMCFSGFVSWGIDLHIITILIEFGLGATAAVAVAAMKGPAILSARLADFFSMKWISAMFSAVSAGVLTVLGLLAAIIFGRDSFGPLLFVIIFSFGTGLMTIVRATLPLSLLGSVGYATTLGRLALPTQIVFAFSPMIFGLVIDAHGSRVALLIALVGALFSLLALLALARLVEQSQGAKS